MFSGEYVEDAFLKTAQIIYECIQDGRYVVQVYLKMIQYLLVVNTVYCYTVMLNNYFYLEKNVLNNNIWYLEDFNTK